MVGMGAFNRSSNVGENGGEGKDKGVPITDVLGAGCGMAGHGAVVDDEADVVSMLR